MDDTMMDLSQSALAKNILKKVGINPSPILERASAPWNQKLLDGNDILLGGEGPQLSTMIPVLLAAGGSCYLDPNLKLEETKAHSLATLSDSKQIPKMKGVIFDASSFSGLRDLKKVYEFFNALLQNLSPNSRIIILTSIPREAETIDAETAAQALCGFSKSLAKELGPKGSTVQLIQVPREETAAPRLAPVVTFFLSDHSAFITGQVIEISLLAKDPLSYQIPGSLAGKIALVTGATGGIGSSTVLALAEEGAHVLCLDHESTSDRLHDLAKKVDGTPLPISLGSDAPHKKLVGAIKEHLGYVDILVHNAGITRDKSLKRMTSAQWEQVLGVNLDAIHDVNAQILEAKLLADFGRIICLSSISGLAGNFGQTNYATAKAGLIGYVRGLGKDLAHRGITVNAVAPGFIETPMTASIPFLSRQFGRRLASLAQGGLPSDIANAICMLASPSSQGINQSVLRVCGGHLMGA